MSSDGAASRPGLARSLSCPQCGNPVTIRAAGQSVTAACPACGGVLDVLNPDVRLIAEAQARTREPLVGIGTRGTLAGTEWEVVGFQARSSEAGSWQWDEYLLFNPYRGFRFLAQDHGHWTLYGMLRREVDDPAKDGGDGRHYRQTETAVAHTDYVLGEFYWRVRVGDTVAVKEFVHPPFVLTEERGDGEVTWSRGRYLEPADVQKAFGLPAMPPRNGRAAHQPEPKRTPLWPVMVAALVAIALIDKGPWGRGLDTPLLSQTFTISVADQDRTLPALPFTIPGTGGNIQIEAQGPSTGALQLEVAVAVAVAVAGETVLQRKDARLIVGSLVGDGPTTQTARFASVAGGAGTLLIRPHSSAFPDPAVADSTPAGEPASAVSFTLRVRRHVPDTLALVLAAAGITIWPILSAVLRWMRSAGRARA